MSDVPSALPLSTPDFLTAQDWTFPVPISYGPGRLAEIPSRCKTLNISAPLIVTDRGSRDLPFVGTLIDRLTADGLTANLFSEISPNPKDTEIDAGVAAFLAGHHDSVIAIGGGSGMDGGKAICMMVAAARSERSISLWDFEWEKPAVAVSAPFPALITIPTTAGTGAEAEATPMITDTKKGMKFCLAHPSLSPSLVILDPELTLALPAHLTAWTGADALTHALEAYLVPDFHPLCDGAALEALHLISKWLPVAYAEPQNLEARGAMLVGSCMAGIAFVKGLGLVHAISHMVGAEFDTQHGLTNAIVLPVILRYNLPNMAEKAKRIAAAMDLEEQTPAGVMTRVNALLDTLQIPTSLQEIGVPSDCVERVALKAQQDSAAHTNPRKASLRELEHLITESVIKAR